MKIESVKCMADDAGWDIVADRPEDYFMRLQKEDWTMDVYYSKKNVIGFKKRKGEKKYLYYVTEKTLDKVLANPMAFYTGVSFTM